MHIISYAGAVMGVVIVAKYFQNGQPAHGDLGYERHKVVGYAFGVFAYFSAGVRSHGIKNILKGLYAIACRRCINRKILSPINFVAP